MLSINEHWGDVERRTQNKVSRSEFINPHNMAPVLLEAIEETRLLLGYVMRFSRSATGEIYHPNGDAVKASSNSHSEGSLHKVRDWLDAPDYKGGLAIDCDFMLNTAAELGEVYLLLERLNIWGGIGIYPHWELKGRPNPGFHLDVRPDTHNKARARWLGVKVDGEQVYKPLTLENMELYLFPRRAGG